MASELYKRAVSITVDLLMSKYRDKYPWPFSDTATTLKIISDVMDELGVTVENKQNYKRVWNAVVNTIARVQKRQQLTMLSMLTTGGKDDTETH